MRILCSVYCTEHRVTCNTLSEHFSIEFSCTSVSGHSTCSFSVHYCYGHNFRTWRSKLPAMVPSLVVSANSIPIPHSPPSGSKMRGWKHCYYGDGNTSQVSGSNLAKRWMNTNRFQSCSPSRCNSSTGLHTTFKDQSFCQIVTSSSHMTLQ